jgi:hypothetical protein
MKIAVDVSPISSQTKSQHKVRGVGMYIGLLKDNLEKYDRKNDYIFSSNIQEDSKEADIVHYPYLDPFFVTFPIFKKKKTSQKRREEEKERLPRLPRRLRK